MDYGMLSRSDLASVTDQSDWYRLSPVMYGSARIVHPRQLGMWSTLLPDIENREFVFRLVNSMIEQIRNPCISPIPLWQTFLFPRCQSIEIFVSYLRQGYSHFSS